MEHFENIMNTPIPMSAKRRAQLERRGQLYEPVKYQSGVTPNQVMFGNWRWYVATVIRMPVALFLSVPLIVYGVLHVGMVMLIGAPLEALGRAYLRFNKKVLNPWVISKYVAK